MDYNRLLEKKEQFVKIRNSIQPEALESFDKSFDVEYAHNSTDIEIRLPQPPLALDGGLRQSEVGICAIHIWERYPNYLKKHFWKEHTFWTNGYFACSVGNVLEK